MSEMSSVVGVIVHILICVVLVPANSDHTELRNLQDEKDEHEDNEGRNLVDVKKM